MSPANCKPKITAAASRGFLATAWPSYCCRRRQEKGRKGKVSQKVTEGLYFSYTGASISSNANDAKSRLPSLSLLLPLSPIPSFLPFPNTLFLFLLPSSSLFPLPSLFPCREAAPSAPCNRLGGLGSALSPPAVSGAKPRPLMHAG